MSEDQNPEQEPLRIDVPEHQDVTEINAGDITVLVVRNDGQGRVGRQRVSAGSRVSDVVGRVSSGEQVRVNGAPATPDQQLNDNDRVSVTPRKVAGAA